MKKSGRRKKHLAVLKERCKFVSDPETVDLEQWAIEVRKKAESKSPNEFDDFEKVPTDIHLNSDLSILSG